MCKPALTNVSHIPTLIIKKEEKFQLWLGIMRLCLVGKQSYREGVVGKGAGKPDEQSLIPRTQMDVGKGSTSASCPLTSIHTTWHVLP